VWAYLINSMAANLPPPLNRILGLWLPPDFAQKQENTLGYVLRQDTLTWETLVVSQTCIESSRTDIRISYTSFPRTFWFHATTQTQCLRPLNSISLYPHYHPTIPLTPSTHSVQVYILSWSRSLHRISLSALRPSGGD
jgi:hypothetical protein